MHTISDAVHPTHAVISIPALSNNVRVVRSLLVPHSRILAVVKADAYGHGMADVARHVVQEGVDYLGVARAYEGVHLRSIGIETPILSFEIVPREHLVAAIEHRLDVTVSALEDAATASSQAGKIGKRARVHVKIDTGMGRLGIPWESAVDTIAKIAGMPHLELIGVYSHFATSEETDQYFARLQLGRFVKVLEGLDRQKVPVQLRHMANSGAILALPEAHFDLVRPGLMLYGYTPREQQAIGLGLQPVMSLVSRVALVKKVDAGTSISYGRRYIAHQPTLIATIPIGYGDGYLRFLTNRADVLIRGKRYRVAGAVCMDQIMVDLGPEAEVTEGDVVTLIGTDGAECISCWEIAYRIGTIPYEITCLVTARVPRVVLQ